MKLTPAQKKIAKDDHRFRVVNAGRRAGKTVLAREEMIGKAVAKSGRKVAYIAPTYSQARDIAWEKLKSRVNPIATDVNESRLEVAVPTKTGGESKIVLSSWNKVESLRGQDFAFVVIDEVAMMDSFWSGWQEVVRPTLTDQRGDALFISTPKGFNHFYDLYNKEAESDEFKSFHFTTYDNPHIPKEEIEQAKEQLPKSKFAQEYMADFRKQEGLVYQAFDRDKHVFDPEKVDINTYKLLCGVDFGFNNPAAVLTIRMDHQTRYWITAEWYKTGKTDTEVAEYVAQGDYNAVYPDPENAAGIEEMRQRNVNIREVDKSPRKRSVELKGLDDVREALKQGRLFVSKQCLATIEEFESYRYPDPKEGRNDYEKPVKENDHAMDSIRYVLMSHRPNVLQDIHQKQRVSSNRHETTTFR